MKKVTLIIIVTILALIVSISRAEMPFEIDECQHCNGMYPRMAVVIGLDYKNDIVTVEDAAGLTWQFDCTDDWMAGDFVTMMMYDNDTPYSIYDDIIVLAFWGGWTLEEFD